MVDETEFIVEVKYLGDTTYYGFPTRQDADGFLEK